MQSVYLCYLFLLFNVTGALSIALGSDCEENGFKGNWTCVKNNDDTVNVILDCNLLEHRSVEVRLYSHKFPINMSRFIIQNCDLLVIDGCGHIRDELMYDPPEKFNFTHLHLVNITNIHLDGQKVPYREDYPCPYYELSEQETSSYLRKNNNEQHVEIVNLHNFGSKTLISITLEKVNKLHPPCCDTRGPIKNDNLEEFNLVNSSLDSVTFYIEDYSIKKFEFLMNNVTVSSKLHDVSMIIQHPEAVVKIINSDFSQTDMVLVGDVTKVLMTGNKFKKLGKNAVVVYAHQFTFSGNSIEKMESCSIQGEFQTTEISNNIINQIVNADIDARPKWYNYSISPKVILNVPPLPCFSVINQNSIIRINGASPLNYSYSFSNNEIHILDNKALGLPKPQDNFNFSAVTIFNNAINCSCQNKGWFKYLTDAKETSKQLYDYWTGGINQNKCLDVQNCTLGQVLKNLEGLCEDNYQCPISVAEVDDSF